MICGIDYSMTSPSLCFSHSTEGDFTLKNCSFHFLTSKKKHEGRFDNMQGDPFPVATGTARFDAISGWVMKWVEFYRPTSVYLEDYAFGAVGRVFHIAENTGLLKYKLWLSDTPVYTIGPTALKKFSTGSGSAKKEAMEVAFIEQTGYNVKTRLGVTPKQWNPSSDIIDSYYICKYGHHKEHLYNGEEQASEG